MAATFRLLLNISVLTAAGDAQAGPDLDPTVIGSSNPYPPRGRAQSVAVRNGVAFCAVGSNLGILDVRDPANLVLVGSSQTDGSRANCSLRRHPIFRSSRKKTNRTKWQNICREQEPSFAAPE